MGSEPRFLKMLEKLKWDMEYASSSMSHKRLSYMRKIHRIIKIYTLHALEPDVAEALDVFCRIADDFCSRMIDGYNDNSIVYDDIKADSLRSKEALLELIIYELTFPLRGENLETLLTTNLNLLDSRLPPVTIQQMDELVLEADPRDDSACEAFEKIYRSKSLSYVSDLYADYKHRFEGIVEIKKESNYGFVFYGSSFE